MRTLGFGVQNPAHPWWWVGARITEALVGFHDPYLKGSRISLVTPAALQGALFNPVDVASGALQLGITTPSVSAKLAGDGKGPYDRPHPALRAIAAYPHVDYVVFAIDASLGIESLEQLVERRPPLRLVTGRRSADGVPDVLTFAVDEILRCYGASFETIESWGGTVTYGGPTHVGGLLMRDGKADALFHEAQMSPTWGEISAARDVRILPIGESVREHMWREFGFEPATIPAGHASGATADTPTIDFSGWLLLCRDDLPDDVAYEVAHAVDTTREGVEDDQRDRGEIEVPIDPRYLFDKTVIPLHDGARAYAADRGYLDEGGTA